MLAYVELVQRREKEIGCDVLTHQKWSGSLYVDRVLQSERKGRSAEMCVLTSFLSRRHICGIKCNIRDGQGLYRAFILEDHPCSLMRVGHVDTLLAHSYIHCILPICIMSAEEKLKVKLITLLNVASQRNPRKRKAGEEDWHAIARRAKKALLNPSLNGTNGLHGQSGSVDDTAVTTVESAIVSANVVEDDEDSAGASSISAPPEALLY